jgi:N-acetylneuraminate synthase
MERETGRERIARFNGRPVGAGHPVYVIGEVGSNHNADLGLARGLVEAAAEAGADAVKFQLFRADWLYPANCGVVETPMGNVDFFGILERYALPPAWCAELAEYAGRLGIQFLCTAFDESLLERVAALNVPAVKIASPELNHLPLLRSAARLRRPLICSTGLSTLGQVEESLEAIRSVWPEPEVVLLQCVSGYPTPPDQSNLAVLKTLARAFGVPVGLSDHTIDYECVPMTMAAVGGCLIEKHFTLSRTLEGPDHSFALEPPELGQLVANIRAVESVEPGKRLEFVAERCGAGAVDAVLGHGRKEIMPAEAPLYPNDKRSIHVLRDLEAGTALSAANLRILRSERNLAPGLHPRHWETVLGARTTRAIAAGAGLQWEDLLQRQET